MQITIEGCVAFGSPLYVGTPEMVAAMKRCNHQFQRESEIPSPYTEATVTIEVCVCGATRFKVEADSEEHLRKIFQ